ncbi:MAG: TetR/AcrR family transcriptional regulator [Candidatus Electryonea clarkiae]|nr:TetR/AcrR family transcriptional regulator [Candidatus Electryonea clarkiae]
MNHQISTEIEMPDFMDRPKKEGDILRKAQELFMQFGYSRITVEELCREASVSKVTFYKYFPNKFAVLEDFFNTLLDGSWKVFEAILEAEAPFVEKLQAIIAMKESGTSKMSPVFYRDLQNGDAVVQQLFVDSVERTTKFMREFFRKGQVNGEIDPDMNIDFLMHMFSVFSDEARSEKVLSYYGDDLVHLSRDALHFLFFGVSGEESSGRK